MPKKYNEHIKEILSIIEGADCSGCKSEQTSPKKDSSDADRGKIKDTIDEAKAKREKAVKERVEFTHNLKSYLVESWLNQVFENSLKNRLSIMSEDTKMLNRSLVKTFVKEEGVDNLLDRMSTKSNLLGEAAHELRSLYEEAMEDIDDFANPSAEDYTKTDFFDKVNDDKDYDEVTDLINSRVSQATKDFIQKNMVDKLDIQELMNSTKERINNVRTGDDETDEAIKTEQTVKLKRAIKEKGKRPHGVFEQIVINLSEAIIANDDTKAKFVTENGKLDMDGIVERAVSFYTMLEMVSTLHLKEMTSEYIKEAISMK